MLVVVQDTLAAKHVSHLGYDRLTTPNLDRLAEEGVSFSNAVTAATYTLASIPSLLTGRLPDRHGLVEYSNELPATETTLAEMMHARGYRTVAFCCSPNASARYGNDQGFDVFREVYRGPAPDGSTRIGKPGHVLHLPRADEVVSLVDEQLDALGADDSLFLFVHFLEPHSPFLAQQEYGEEFTDARCSRPYREQDWDWALDVLAKAEEGESPAAPDIAHIAHMFDANIAWSDANLGRILDRLRARGLYEDALIVSTADHGEVLFEHGYFGHGHTLFEEELRVPLVVKLPGREGPRGVVRDELASTMDVVPTLVEALQLDAPAALDGVSLLPVLRGEGPGELASRRELLCRAGEEYRVFCWRRPHEKLVFRFSGEGFPGEVAEAERYDLVEDPDEQHPLGGERFREHEEALARLRATLGALHHDRSRTDDSPSEEELELLQRLGYTGER